MEMREELQRTQHRLFLRISRVEDKMQEMLETCRDDAAEHHDLTLRLSAFQEEVVLLRSEVHTLTRSPTSAGGQASSTGNGLQQEFEDMHLRAIRAEMELKAVRAELELKASRADFEIRAVRAEEELRILRNEVDRSNETPSHPQESKSWDKSMREPSPLSATGKRVSYIFGPPDLDRDLLPWLQQQDDEFADRWIWSTGLQAPPASLDLFSPRTSLSTVDFGTLDNQEGLTNGTRSDTPDAVIVPVLVLGRYEVHPLDMLGHGGFSCVRRGLDTESGKYVALKSYTAMEVLSPEHFDFEESRRFYLNKFRHEVDIFHHLHKERDMKSLVLKQKAKEVVKVKDKRFSWLIPNAVVADDRLLSVFDEFPSSDDLFVKLVDFSKEKRQRKALDSPAGSPVMKTSRSMKKHRRRMKYRKRPKENVELAEEIVPAPDQDGICYIVLELADYTLYDYLQHRSCFGPTLSAPEVTQIFRQLTQTMVALHARNFVHVDLKPINVMHFPSGRWKLIDMDGMVTPGLVSADEVCYTALYTAPEMAEQLVAGADMLEVSRHLDVWSLGLCVCELLTVRPMLEPKLDDMGGVTEFLKWLAQPNIPVRVPQSVWDFDPLLADVCQRMLTKDKNHRVSMIEVLIHPFFTGAEGVEAVLERDNRIEMDASCKYSRSLLYRAASAKVVLLEQRQKHEAALSVTRHCVLSGTRQSMAQIVRKSINLGTEPSNKKRGSPPSALAGDVVRKSLSMQLGGLANARREHLWAKVDRRSSLPTATGDRVAGKTSGWREKRVSLAASMTCMKRSSKRQARPVEPCSPLSEFDEAELSTAEGDDEDRGDKAIGRLHALVVESSSDSEQEHL